jgi:MFS family permease
MMADITPNVPAQRLSAVQWLICSIAAIGFAFDIYELLMLPLILRPAVVELVPGAIPGSDLFQTWYGRLFYIPAFVGGIFGLYGGYLTDRLGRRRVLTWSILLYAFSAFFGGFATNIWVLLFFRSTKFIGVCVEFVAAVAWLAELFPDHQQRERVLGYTQAFSSIGGLLVAIANELAQDLSASLWPTAIPAALTGFLGTIQPEHQHEAWRYTMMSGLIPAIPLIFIRPFLPESPVWAQKRAAGNLRRPSIAELFSPALRKTTIVTTIMFACSYGVAFGAIQHVPQIVPGLADVKARVADAVSKLKLPPDEEAAKKMKMGAQRPIEQKVASQYTKVQELGGLVGRFLMALLAVRILSRRKLLRVFQIPGLILTPLVFIAFLNVQNRTFFEINLDWIYLGHLPITTMSLGLSLCGLLTVAQFSFWGNYLPVVYPVHLRGTGESFAANIGGRMIGTSFAWITATIVQYLPDSVGLPSFKFAYTAAGVAFFVFLVGSIACFFLPEPDQSKLAE